MREMLSPTSAIAGMGLDKQVALVTTAVFRRTRGGHRPHLARGAKRRQYRVRREGDIISINIPSISWTDITDAELAKRRKETTSKPKKQFGGYIGGICGTSRPPKRAPSSNKFTPAPQ
jgi:dihydroxy-acid dehydratase